MKSTVIGKSIKSLMIFCKHWKSEFMPRSKSKKNRRKQRAHAHSAHLSGLLLDLSMPMAVRHNAARHLRKVSMRHRISLISSINHAICKNCQSALIPGKFSRARIRSGIRCTTCLNCGHVRRFGSQSKSEVVMISKPPKSILQMAQSKELQPTVRIGKQGLTDSVIEELRSQFNQRDFNQN